MLSSITACSLCEDAADQKKEQISIRRCINEMRKKAAGNGDYPHLSLSWLRLGFCSLGNTELSAQLLSTR